MSRPSTAAIAKLVAGFVIAGFFAWRAFGKLDWKAAAEAVRGADFRWLFAAVLALAVDYTIRVVRWWTMLRAINPGVSFARCFRPFVGSIALNNVLPFRAGDVARAVGFGKDLGIETSEIVGTMVIERLLDLLSIVAVFALALPRGGTSGIPPSLISGIGVAAVVGGSVLLLILLAPQRAARLLDRLFSKRSERAQRIARAIIRFLDSLAVLRSPGRAAGLVALSFAAWIFEGATFAATAAALHQSNGSAGGWFAMSVGTLSTMIPSTPGAIGVFDYFTAIAFRGYGMPQDASTLAALVVHIILWLPLTLVGLLLLGLGRRQGAALDRVALPPETV